MRAPIPFRLLRLPCNFRISQELSPLLVFSHNSAGSPIALTTTSILPSLLKSAKAAPRCARGTWNSRPASPDTSWKIPSPAPAKMLLGNLYLVASNNSTVSLTCALAVNRSFQPSLFKSNRPALQPLRVRLSASSWVVVREGNAHRFADIGRDAGMRRHVFEGPIAVIVVQRVRQPFIKTGMAIRTDLPLGIATVRWVLGRPLQIVRHK